MRLSPSPRFSNVYLIALLFPLVLDAPALLNIVNADPAVFYSTIATNVRRGMLPGLPLIDPSVGFIFESLGRRAAEELLSGRLPWWNPFEGVGAPLAGEMNVGAFFPLTLLLIFPHGQTYSQVIVQICAGVGTLLFLRRLGLGRVPALTAALLFEINGTMAWLASGWSYSQSCLPFLLFGIELLRDTERRTRLIGSITVALAVAFSIASGFIEVAYLNGLLAVGWSGLRFVQTPRAEKPAFGVALCASGVLGALLAAPVVIAFFDYLHVAYVGPHTGEGFAHAVLPLFGVAQKFMPYLFGPIFGFSSVAELWANTGGYALFGVTTIAIAALAGRSQRAVRLYFAIWTLLAFGATFGIPVIHGFVRLWPGVRFTAQYRYLDSSLEFALCVLVAFALSDVATLPKRALLARAGFGIACVAALCTSSVALSLPVVRAFWSEPGTQAWFTCSVLFALTISAGILVALTTGSAQRRPRQLAVVVIVEAIVCYTLPMLSYPTAATINTAGVDFLRRNIGFSRMYSMGPMYPNYGSYYGVPSINHNDVPMPSDWITYVLKHLDPYIEPLLFLGNRPGPESNVPSREDVLHDNLSNFEAIGVKYVLTFPVDRRLFQKAFEPPVGAGAQGAQNLLHAAVDLTFPSLPSGTISEIQLLQGNYRHTADGTLRVRLCAGATCVRGQRRLSESGDNTYLSVPLEHPLRIDGVALAVRLEQVHAQHPDALWWWDGSAPAAQSIVVNGASQPGKGARVRLIYTNQTAELPVLPGGNQAYDFAAGKAMTVHVRDIPRNGTVEKIGILIGTNRGTADGSLHLRACSSGTCTGADRALAASPDNDFAWFTLQHRLNVNGHDLLLNLVHRGGRTSAAMWLWPLAAGATEETTLDRAQIDSRGPRIRLDYTGSDPVHAELVYRDDTMNIYALNGYEPYFKAPGCSVYGASRTTVTVDCAHESRLVRLELQMAGWSATVNGRGTAVERSGDLFQAIALPQGRSAVVFAFTPPFMAFGYAAFATAAVVLSTQIVLVVRPRREKRLVRVVTS